MQTLPFPARRAMKAVVACAVFILWFPVATTSFGIRSTLSPSSSPSISLSALSSFSKFTTTRRRFLPTLQLTPYEYNYNEDGISALNTTKLDTALAIVPPLRDWDRLQRARHFARDILFHQWPPAIRLFHPFRASPLEVAQAIEELQLEPFEITFDTWVIIPQLEAMEAAWKSARSTPPVEDLENYSYNPIQAQEDEAVRKLIEREEQIGLQKAKARGAKRKASNKTTTRDNNYSSNKEEGNDDDDEIEDIDTIDFDNDDASDSPDSRDDPSRTFQQQQQQLDDFGGPSLLCLEPDAESRQLLQDLREELALLLNHDSDYFSPSSIYSYKYLTESFFRPDDYRPVIPIGAFESLQAALQVARRLKGLWGDPLTFEVKELHVLSCRDEGTILAEDWKTQPWGCNAKIMLLGEEPQNDEDTITEQINLLLEKGEAGGKDISNDYTILEDEEEISDLEMWLNNDDDFDEGMQVLIGRTYFYTGDQRSYKGMPASSVMDSRDKSLGDVGSVSGLARRRRTNARSGNNQWEDGEYGRRHSDYLPWTKREKPKKVERLLDLRNDYQADTWEDGEEEFSSSEDD